MWIGLRGFGWWYLPPCLFLGFQWLVYSRIAARWHRWSAVLAECARLPCIVAADFRFPAFPGSGYVFVGAGFAVRPGSGSRIGPQSICGIPGRRCRMEYLRASGFWITAYSSFPRLWYHRIPFPTVRIPFCRHPALPRAARPCISGGISGCGI